MTSLSDLVSIIVPTRNRVELLGRALASLQAQTYAPLEIVVVNDGGAPISSVLAAFHESGSAPVRVVELPERVGMCRARNAGLASARGAIIGYLDDDDRWGRDFLSSAVPKLQGSRAEAIYGDYDRVSLVRNPVAADLTEAGRTRVVTPVFDRGRLLQSNFLPINCVLHRASLVGRFGMFDEWLTGLEDWDLWLRYSRETPFEHVDVSGPEVSRVEGVAGMTDLHRWGFIWPSLNILYKLEEEHRARHDGWNEDVERALETLIAHTLGVATAPDAASWSALYAFHAPDTVVGRLQWLAGQYKLFPGRFALLEALVQLIGGRADAAVGALDRGIAATPGDADLHAIKARIA